MTGRPSRRELARAAQVLRLRHDARRARMHAMSVTDADDLQLYLQLAADWEREAELLENAANDAGAANGAGRRARRP